MRVRTERGTNGCGQGQQLILAIPRQHGGQHIAGGIRPSYRAPPRHRLARHFREAEGLSIAGIAERLGRSPARIKAYFYDPTGEKAQAVKARYVGVPRLRRLHAAARAYSAGWPTSNAPTVGCHSTTRPPCRLLAAGGRRRPPVAAAAISAPCRQARRLTRLQRPGPRLAHIAGTTRGSHPEQFVGVLTNRARRERGRTRRAACRLDHQRVGDDPPGGRNCG